MRFNLSYFFLCALFCLISLSIARPVWAQTPERGAPNVGQQVPVAAQQLPPQSEGGGEASVGASVWKSLTKRVTTDYALALLLALTGLIACVLLAALIVKLVRGSKAKSISQLEQSSFFWLGVVYMVLLFMAAIVYYILPIRERPYVLGGILPIAVPWFGAIGAVTISLEGVFNRKDDPWDPRYNYWHIGRPLFGAVLGVVSFFMFVLLANASGAQVAFLNPKAPAPGSADRSTPVVFYVVAFLVGYREETFRELVKRATDLILKPGEKSAPGPAVAITAVGNRPLAKVELSKTSNRVQIEVRNTGTVPLTAPNVAVVLGASTPSNTFALENDEVTGKGDLAPGQCRTVVVVLNAVGAGIFSGSLTVSGANIASPKTVDISATA